MSIGSGIGAGLAAVTIAAVALVGVSRHEPGDGRPASATRSPGVEASTTGLGWPPFPRSRYWSRPIAAGAAIDSRSGEFAAYLNEQLRRSDGMGPFLAIRSYGVPIWVGRASDPVVTLGACSSYSCPGVGGARVHLPAAARPDPGDDGHMVIVDPRRHVAYDLFRAHRTDGGWAGVGGARVNLVRGDGSTGKIAGATAAHSALLAGLIRPSEIRRGRIDHALAITVPGIGHGAPRCPADRNVPTSDRADAPPEGTRFQLDPTIDLATLNLSRVERVIARALQRYGMIVTDNSGQVAFRGENFVGKAVDGWSRLGYPRGDSLALEHIPLYRTRVIAGPAC